MKKNLFLQVVLVILFSVIFNSLSAQQTSDKIKIEITEVLKIWNSIGTKEKLDLALTQFDNTDNIMLVGSDSGEIYKGREQIKGWLSALFEHASFSWEMNRIDIDDNGNTAWVFVDGAMLVKFDTGKTLKRPYRFTGVMVKKDDVWKWRLFDGSIPKGE